MMMTNRVTLAALALLFLLSLAGCGSGDSKPSPPADGSAVAPAPPEGTPPAPPPDGPSTRAKSLPSGGPPPELLLQTGNFPNVACVTLSPDGRYALAGSRGSGWEKTVLWNLASGRQVAAYDRLGWVHTLEFAPDGRHFFVADPSLASLWSVDSGGPVVKYPVEGEFGTSEDVGPCRLSPSGKIVAICGGKGHLTDAHLCDAGTGRVLHVLEGHSYGIDALAFNDDETRIATGAGRWYEDDAGIVHWESQMRVWDVETGECLHTVDLDPHSAPVVADLAFAPDGRHVLCAQGRKATLWDTEAGTAGYTVEVPEDHTIFSLTFTPDGAHFLLAEYESKGGEVSLHETATGRKVRVVAPSGTSHYPPNHAARFTPDGKYLAIPDLSFRRERLRVFDASGETLIHDVALQPYLVAHIQKTSFDTRGALAIEYLERPPGQGEVVPRAAALRLDPLGLRALDPPVDPETTPEHLALLAQIKERPVSAPVFSPDRRRMVAVIPNMYTFTDGDRLVFFDTERKEIVSRVHLKDCGMTSVEFSPDGRYVLGQTHPNAAILWDAATGEEIRRFLDQADFIAAHPDLTSWWDRLAVFSRGGREVMANELQPNGVARTVVFDTETGEPLRVLETCLNRAPVFSPDGLRMAVKGEVLDVKKGRVLGKLPEGYWVSGFSPDGRLLSAVYEHGETSSAAIFDAASGRTLATITIVNDSQWIAVTPEGYFHGTDEACRAVSWRIGGEVFPLELYGEVFHRPDLVEKALKGERLSDVPAVSGSYKPPRVEVEAGEVDANSVLVKSVATPGSPGVRLGDARVYVDGRDLATVQNGAVTRTDRADGAVEFGARVEFSPGRSRAVVAVTVVDEYGLRSLPGVLSIARPGPTEPVERRLFVLAVGVSDYGDPKANLAWADADAEALAAALQGQEGMAFSKVETRVLTNEAATADAIREGLRWLGKECRRSDSAVVHFSGHGAQDRAGALYFVPRGADPADVAGTFLRWNDVASGLKQVKASDIVFLADCCHAGAFGLAPASESDLAAVLLREARVMVFSSSRGMESSLEMESLKHGAFTYALLTGLGGAADLIPDKRITISELQTWVATQVRVLTEDRQHPHIPLMQDFDPELVVGHVR